jgi:hypothetical protein
VFGIGFLDGDNLFVLGGARDRPTPEGDHPAVMRAPCVTSSNRRPCAAGIEPQLAVSGIKRRKHGLHVRLISEELGL